jgi:hypothetical protein
MAAADSLFLSKYMTLQESMRLSIGHAFNSLINYCSFGAMDCKNRRYIQLVGKMKGVSVSCYVSLNKMPERQLIPVPDHGGGRRK